MILHIHAVRAGTALHPCPNGSYLLANDPHIRFNPFAVWNTATLARTAFSGWSAPEPDILELIEAVGAAARIRQQFIAFAGRRDGGYGTEPRRQVSLQFRVQ